MRATGMKVRTGFVPCGSVGQRARRPRRLPDVAHRAVAVAEAAAGQADLAEQRGQRDPGPDRLLAVLGALQRPGDRDQRARAPPSAAPARVISRPGCRRSPPPTPASFGTPSALAEQVALEALVRRRSSGRGTRGRAGPRSTRVCASASISAASVPGTTG